MTVQQETLLGDIQEKMDQYRTALLAFGMREPTKRQSRDWQFYKPVTELTAFVVNLQRNDFYVEVTYGYASTAFTRMAGDENALQEWGVSDGEITIREKIIICDASDESIAENNIARMYKNYLHTQKDDLLLCAKEKRKAFIQQIHEKLKPLGFRKKGNNWTHTLAEPYYLMFNAQKSAFSDQYYFNIYVGKNGTNDYGDCYAARISHNGRDPMDWQALCQDEFDFFLNKTVIPKLKRILDTPLTELGNMSSYWSGCHCNRKKCGKCWIKKNLWEAKL